MAEIQFSEPAVKPDSSFSPRLYLFTSLLKAVQGRELWALSDQALVSAANFLTNVMLARALGLSGFGVFAFAWMVVLLMSSLQGALIITPMMSIGPKQELALRPSYFGAVSMQALCLSAFSGILIFLGAFTSIRLFPSWHLESLPLPLAVATAAYLLQDYTRRYFFTIRRSRLAFSCDALSYVTQLPLLWLLAWRKELTTSRALWMIALTSLFGVIVSLFWREQLHFSRMALRTVVRRHWKMVRWLAPSALLQWTSVNLFMVFAPVYYGAEALGALRACLNVVAISHIWILGLDNVLPAEAARQLHEHGVNASYLYIRKTLIRWGIVTLVFMTLISVAPSFWLSLLYGARYAGFGYVLRLYSLLYLMVFLGVPLRAGLQALEVTAPLLWSYFAMTVFAALIAPPMAKHLGLLGVMLGLIVSQCTFQLILGAALVVHTRRMRKRELAAVASVGSNHFEGSGL